jgi:hypothetical protein
MVMRRHNEMVASCQTRKAYRSSPWLVQKIFFCELPEKIPRLHIKPQEFTIIAINFSGARS